jgi:hypothetical protein
MPDAITASLRNPLCQVASRYSNAEGNFPPKRQIIVGRTENIFSWKAKQQREAIKNEVERRQSVTFRCNTILTKY